VKEMESPVPCEAETSMREGFSKGGGGAHRGGVSSMGYFEIGEGKRSFQGRWVKPLL